MKEQMGTYLWILTPGGHIMHWERGKTENLREMRQLQSRRRENSHENSCTDQMEIFNFIGTVTFPIKMRKQTLFPIMLWTRQHNSPNHRCKEPQLLFRPTATPFTCQWNIEMEKSAQRSLSELSQAPQAPTCVIKHEFPLVFKEMYENIPLIGLYKTSNSNINISPKENMAHCLFFAIYKSFRTRIPSYSSWMFTLAP